MRLQPVLADLDFQEAADQRTRIAIACKHLRQFEPNGMNYEAIGKFLGVGGSVVRAQWERSQSEPRDSGRPGILSPQIESWMQEVITARFREHRPITYTALIDMLQFSHDITISGDTLRHADSEVDHRNSHGLGKGRS
jgi:transposase